MDNHIFRSAAWGFNRQDVMDYIERTQKDAEANAAALNSQLDEVTAELAEVRRQLEESTRHEEDLSNQLEDCRRQFEQEKTEHEALLDINGQQEASIRSLTEERDRLAEELDELSGQKEGVRREKEKLTQLELDAHSRVDELLDQTRKEADEILTRAKNEADAARTEAEQEAANMLDQARQESETMLADAKSESEEMLAAARGKIEDSVRECGELFETCEKISADVAGELRRLSSINGRLPGHLKGLKAGLAQLRMKADDQPGASE